MNGDTMKTYGQIARDAHINNAADANLWDKVAQAVAEQVRREFSNELYKQDKEIERLNRELAKVCKQSSINHDQSK